MNKIIKQAKKRLESIGCPCMVENGTLYVIVADTPLELSEFEIKFQSEMYLEMAPKLKAK